MGSNSQIAYQAQFHAPVTALEGNSANVRPLYVLYIPAFLILTGILSWVIGGDLGLSIGSFSGAAVALYVLWDWLFNHGPTRFSTLFGMTLLLGYAFGSLNTILTLPRGPLSLSEFMGLGTGVLSQGIAGVLFSAAPLFFLGEIFERPLFHPGFKLQINQDLQRLIYIGAVAMLAGYATHSLVIGAAGAASNGHASIPGMFLSWLYAPLASLSVVAFINAKQRKQKIWNGLVSLIFLLMFAVRGRRVSIYTTVEILFALSLAGYKWRGKGFRNVLLIVSLVAIIAVTGLVFMLLRIAPVRYTPQNPATIVQRAKAANQLVVQGDAFALAAQSTRTNAETRTFILSFLANILNASFHKTPALGRDALGLAEVSIPRIIDPYKDEYFTEENFVDELFGFGYGDQANSVLTAGATDFSLAGMITYPLLLILFARVVFVFLSRWLKPIPMIFVTFAFIDMFLQTEITLTGYITSIRNDIIFGIAIQAFLMLPRFGLRANHLRDTR